MKNGFILALPLLIITVVVIGGFSTLSYLSDQHKKQAVGKVLSENSGETKGESSSDSGKSGSSGTGDNKTGESKPSTSNTFTSKTKIESTTGSAKVKIETGKHKSEIKVKSPEGKFETKTEKGKQKTKIETGGLKIEIRIVNGQTVVKIKNEHDEEVEASREAENELLEDANEKLEEEDIKIASTSAGLGFVHHGKRVRTNFPLTIDPSTGQLFVTTPSGTKVVAILPQTAIDNMLRAGILTHVEEPPTPSPSPPESTSSATPSATVAGAAIELTQIHDQPVYIISGIRQQNFLGVVPIDIKLKAVVSIQNGQLLSVQQSILARLLDFFSF